MSKAKVNSKLNYWSGFEISESTSPNDYSPIIDELKKLGYKVTISKEYEKLGEGARSEVFDIGGKLVLKISDDEDIFDEIEEYKKLIGKRLKNVVKVLKVGNFGVFGYVVMEKLFLNDSDLFFDGSRIDIEISISERMKKNSNISFEDMFNDIITPAVSKLIIDEDLFIEYVKQVFNGVKELQKYGVEFNDIHDENIMIDKNGNYKIIDFLY